MLMVCVLFCSAFAVSLSSHVIMNASIYDDLTYASHRDSPLPEVNADFKFFRAKALFNFLQELRCLLYACAQCRLCMAHELSTADRLR
jgi:hypothetical protein